MDAMTLLPATAGSSLTPPRKPDDPARIHDAAQQFEALLLTNILKTVRESGSGWMGSGQDASGQCATEYAEQELAAQLARQGGLGLAEMVGRALGSQTSAAGGEAVGAGPEPGR